MRRISMLLLALVLVAGAVACGKDEKKTAASSTTKASTTSTTTSTTTVPCNFAGTVAPQRRNSSTPTTFLLTNVTIAASGCIDTVTFDFTPDGPASEPPYQLEYKDPPFAQSGSGEPVTVPGTAFLVIRFQPAWIADITREGAPPSYTGPHEITATGTSFVKGMALYDAYEAVVGWVIGLDGQHPVRVDETASPPRLVINVGP